MKSLSNLSFRKCSAVFIGTLFLMSSAFAQNVLEEIVVTAQKREQSLQDAAVAVTAFTGDQLSRAGVLDPDTLAEIVPNVDVNSEANRDGLIIVMRGVAGTDVRNGADPTTGFHVDGNYVPRLSGANAYFFDTERVEILRGPQGTLYGRNSTSGVVNVISKKPVQGETSAELELGFGNFSQFVASGAANIPINDKVAFRGSFMRNSRDGYSNNGGPLSTGIREDANDADEAAFRAHVLWDAGDNTSVLFTGERYDRNGVGQALSNLGCLSEAELAPFGLTTATAAQPNGAPITCNNAANPIENNPLNTQGLRDNHDNNFRIQIDHGFDGSDLFYQGAFRSHNRQFMDDDDGGAIIANGFASDASIIESTESETISHEIRLSSNTDNRFQWIAGLFYLEETINGIFQVDLARDSTRNAGMAPGPVSMFGFDEQIVQFIDRDLTNESFAVFFSESFAVTDAVNLNAGVRWTRDEKDKGGNFADPESGSTFNVFFINNGTNGDPTGRSFNIGGSSDQDMRDAGIPQVSNPDWSEVTWNVGVDWHVNDSVFTYAKISTGFKSGGWNRGSQGTTDNGELFVFEPEEIIALEFGAKMDLLEGRGRLNLAAFYYDYTDMQQAAIFTNPVDGTRTNITFNAAESTIWGFEAEGTLLFGETGSANLALGYLSAEFDEFVGFQDDFTGAEVDVSGNDLPRAPDFNLTLSVIPATFEGLGGTWTPQIQFHYETESFFDISNRTIGPAGAGARDDYTKTNVTLGYEHGDGKFYGEAFIFNLEDDDIFNGSGCGSAVGSATSTPNPVFNCTGTFEPPQTYGVRLGYRF